MSCQPYPLYERLAVLAEKNKDKALDITSICNRINALERPPVNPDSQAHFYEIAALILHHEALTNRGVFLSLVPYEGRTVSGGKGIIYNIANLPPFLQHIIAQYLQHPMGC